MDRGEAELEARGATQAAQHFGPAQALVRRRRVDPAFTSHQVITRCRVTCAGSDLGTIPITFPYRFSDNMKLFQLLVGYLLHGKWSKCVKCRVTWRFLPLETRELAGRRCQGVENSDGCAWYVSRDGGLVGVGWMLVQQQRFRYTDIRERPLHAIFSTRRGVRGDPPDYRGHANREIALQEVAREADWHQPKSFTDAFHV